MWQTCVDRKATDVVDGKFFFGHLFWKMEWNCVHTYVQLPYTVINYNIEE